MVSDDIFGGWGWTGKEVVRSRRAEVSVAKRGYTSVGDRPAAEQKSKTVIISPTPPPHHPTYTSSTTSTTTTTKQCSPPAPSRARCATAPARR